MPTYSMAIDIGASSGRAILGWMENGAIRLKEIRRFANGAKTVGGTLQWDAQALFREILAGMKKAGDLGTPPASVAVDTWGVDFVLLDGADAPLGPVVSYRDSRTDGMDAKVYEAVPEAELYARTGVVSWIFNTVYQLAALREKSPEMLDAARTFLMMPDYLHFLLTGQKQNEYTEASTSQLLGATSRDWDREILRRLNIPEHMFLTPAMPGTRVGTLLPAVRDAVGYDCEVVLPPSHDTASAVLAVPATDDKGIYLSSGTWSLMGIERLEPDCRDECRALGFTNEGGCDKRYTFLKNIMGLWILQSLRKELNPAGGFEEIAALAKTGMDYDGFFDVNDASLLAPANMGLAVRDCCVRSGCPAPKTDSQTVASVYRSLAKSYAETVTKIEELSGRTYERVNIVGGGCQDAFLNALTAQSTGKPVYAGPVEATALGNILSQMIRRGDFQTLESARQTVATSFEVRKV